jgi:serine/threonine protein kinase
VDVEFRYRSTQPTDLESLLPILDFLYHQSPPAIHRDIKPANIIWRSSDIGLVLVDFSAAKQVTQSMT